MFPYEKQAQLYRNAQAERNGMEQRNAICGKALVTRLSSESGSGTAGARQGRGAFGFPSPFRGEGKTEKQQPRPGAPLSEAERNQVAANVEKVRQLMPELVPTIKALHEAGLIDGWRAVRQIGPELAPEPTAITLDRICIVTEKQRVEEEQKFGRRPCR